MICFFASNPDSDLDAKDVQDQVEALVARVELSDTVQERQDGRFILQFRLETAQEMLKRRAIELGVVEQVARLVVVDETPSEQVKTGERAAPGPRRVYFSPALAGIDISSFRPGRAFGDGVTLNCQMPLSVGGVKMKRLMSWCVFQAGTNLEAGQLDTLRGLFEG